MRALQRGPSAAIADLERGQLAGVGQQMVSKVGGEEKVGPASSRQWGWKVMKVSASPPAETLAL